MSGDADYSFRDDLTPAERATPLDHTVDPGFVHYRLRLASRVLEVWSVGSAAW